MILQEELKVRHSWHAFLDLFLAPSKSSARSFNQAASFHPGELFFFPLPGKMKNDTKVHS